MEEPAGGVELRHRGERPHRPCAQPTIAGVESKIPAGSLFFGVGRTLCRRHQPKLQSLAVANRRQKGPAGIREIVAVAPEALVEDVQHKLPKTRNQLQVDNGLTGCDGGITWKAQHASKTAMSGALQSVAFLDTSRGWAVGYGLVAGKARPVILATIDGGATWTAQDAKSAGGIANLSSVSFPDALHGWATGSSWDVQTQSSAPRVLATSDGGASWRQQDSRAGVGWISSVCFVDAARGWLVGNRQSGSGIYNVTPFILAATR